MLRKSQKLSLDALEWQVLKKAYSEELYQNGNKDQIFQHNLFWILPSIKTR